MILGFIGTGKISSSIIFGIFKSKLKVKRIYISSRNKNIAKKLAKKYRKIKVLNNNQEIIDKSSTIFLSVTPNVGNKILSKLHFSKNKKIISLISTINLDKLKKLTKNKNIVRATPLPPIEIKKGPIIICPPNKGVKNLIVITPGFASDCIETLEEVSMEYKDLFLELGGKNFSLIPCLNDSDDGIKLIGNLLESNLWKT